MNKNAVIAIALFLITDAIVWFQLNAQFISEWWKQRPILMCALTAFPIAFGYYYAWSHAIVAFGGWWATRFIGFALTFFVFPPLTWYFLGESPFTLKTMACVFLALCILGVQAYLK